ncbi:MAG: peptidoglycan DD-metalloendopeptidase family protein [Cyanobacteriota bacterium]|nr:peptidoglycan DD-metalloendopeptidase family protein [Cyanobacteriota bacterium]
MSRLRVWLIGILCLAILFVSPIGSVFGQTVDSLKQQQEQIRQQMDTVKNRSEALQQKETQAQQKLGAIQQGIDVTDTRIQDNLFRLKKAEEALDQLGRKLQESEANLARQIAGTEARLRYLQRQGSEKWWALLLTSKDLNQFFDRRYQMKLLLEADRRLITQLQEQSQDVTEQRIKVQEQRNEIALLNQELEIQQNQLEQQATTQQQLISRLKSERTAYEAAQRRLEADSGRIEQMINQLIQQMAAQPSQQGIPVRGTGQFQFPIAARVTSPFGMRIHPIYGIPKMHNGIDFGAGSGVPIKAADRATVLYAGWYGGYGNTVILNHGNGLTTLYAHNSSLAVSTGQVVQKGQMIARVGSSGLSTGPHAHFEVRQRGRPVNPLSYL